MLIYIYIYKKHPFFFFWREQHVYPYKTFHISLRCRKLCQEDAVLLGNKMKSPVNQKYIVSSCSCFAMKTCSIRGANTSLSLSVAQAVKIEFHFSLIFIDSMQYFIDFHSKNGCITAYISTRPNLPR